MRLLNIPRSFRIMIDTIIWGHGTPAENAGCSRCSECDYIRTGERSGRRRVDEVFASDTEHYYECDHIRNPGDALISKMRIFDQDSQVCALEHTCE
jgi:hypothetical protein